jgi:hypothetical protein
LQNRWWPRKRRPSIKAFDDGFQFKLCDLVILTVRDREKSIDTLASIGRTAITPQYTAGTVGSAGLPP